MKLDLSKTEFNIKIEDEENNKDKRFRKIVNKFRNQNQGILFRNLDTSKTFYGKNLPSLDDTEISNSNSKGLANKLIQKNKDIDTSNDINANLSSNSGISEKDGIIPEEENIVPLNKS